MLQASAPTHLGALGKSDTVSLLRKCVGVDAFGDPQGRPLKTDIKSVLAATVAARYKLDSKSILSTPGKARPTHRHTLATPDVGVEAVAAAARPMEVADDTRPDPQRKCVARDAFAATRSIPHTLLKFRAGAEFDHRSR